MINPNTITKPEELRDLFVELFPDHPIVLEWFDRLKNDVSAYRTPEFLAYAKRYGMLVLDRLTKRRAECAPLPPRPTGQALTPSERYRDAYNREKLSQHRL